MEPGEDLWSQLLELKTACNVASATPFAVLCDPDKLALCGDADAARASGSLVIVTTAPLSLDERDEAVLVSDRLWLYAKADAAPGFVDCIRHYVPLCMAPSRHDESPFVIVHMAQSLDGKVCTESGNSKWIGNPENLTHAHRVRALVDGVLVGGNTARQDLPQLSVRRVEGEDPARILFSDSFDEVGDLPVVDGVRTILLRSARRGGSDDTNDAFETVCFDVSDGATDIRGLLARLKSGGIRSLLIEGGPLTFRSFLDAGAVDWLQLHIAPIILGAGKSIVTLPPPDSPSDALALRDPFSVAMGDAVMMTGSL